MGTDQVESNEIEIEPPPLVDRPPAPVPPPARTGRFWILISLSYLVLVLLVVAASAFFRQMLRGPGLESTSPEAVYEEILTVWDLEGTSAARSLLWEGMQRWPRDQRLHLFYAACIRCNFSRKVDARKVFLYVHSLDPDSPQGRCADYMIRIDTPSDVAAPFADLMELLDEVPDDPVLLWLGGIAGRELRQNFKGAQCYERLFAQIEKGPAIVHHTYANLLEDLERYDEALVHRRTAVDLNPGGWTYQGLINTLLDAGELEEALEHCPRMVELAPDDALYRTTWGACLFEAGQPEEAKQKYLEAADMEPENPEHYYYLARRLRTDGNGEEAIAYCQQAASRGHRAAMNELGRMYTFGLAGVEKDLELGLQYFRQAAGKGDRYAMYNLGYVYFHGLGVEKDFTIAMSWYRRAVKHGNSTALVDIADMYRTGKGVRRNHKEALRLYRQASEHGSHLAMSWVGRYYVTGKGGMGKDLEQAVHWYTRAAEAGSNFAASALIRLLIFRLEPDDQSKPTIGRMADLLIERGTADDLNNVSWLLATAKNESFCDGERAVRAAEKAVEEEPGNVMYIDTLAAAYARDGQFDLAIQTQQKAIEAAQAPEYPEDWGPAYRERLALYQAGKPFVEVAK